VYIYNKKLDIRKRKIKNKKEVMCKKEIKLAISKNPCDRVSDFYR
jgi:hypothetical protein